MNKILIIENDAKAAVREADSIASGLKDVNIQICLSGMEGLHNLKSKSFDLVIAESRPADMTALELLRRMGEIGGHWPTIIIALPERGNEAVKFMREGVYDYMLPDSEFPRKLTRAAERALEMSYMFNEKGNIAETSIGHQWRRELVKITHVLNHEVNNPLMTILGNIQLLLSKPEISQGELREKLEVIEESAHRIARVMAYFADRDNESPADDKPDARRGDTVTKKADADSTR